MTAYRVPKNLGNMASRTAAAIRRYREADRDRVRAALEAGALLVAAKDAAEHGQWLPYLKHLGVPARTAQDWMAISAWAAELSADLHRPGLDVQIRAVAYLGGIRATLERIREHGALAAKIGAVKTMNREARGECHGLKRRLHAIKKILLRGGPNWRIEALEAID